MIWDGKNVIHLSPGLVFEHEFSLLVHTIHNAAIAIINQKEFIFVDIAFLQKARDVDSMSNTGHKLRDDVALDDISVVVDGKYSDLL